MNRLKKQLTILLVLLFAREGYAAEGFRSRDREEAREEERRARSAFRQRDEISDLSDKLSRFEVESDDELDFRDFTEELLRAAYKRAVEQDEEEAAESKKVAIGINRVDFGRGYWDLVRRWQKGTLNRNQLENIQGRCMTADEEYYPPFKDSICAGIWFAATGLTHKLKVLI